MTQKNDSEIYAELYPKYRAGTAWLDARKAEGKDVEKDTEEFIGAVLAPLQAAYAEMTPEERKGADDAAKVYDAMKGKKMAWRGKCAPVARPAGPVGMRKRWQILSEIQKGVSNAG